MKRVIVIAVVMSCTGCGACDRQKRGLQQQIDERQQRYDETEQQLKNAKDPTTAEECTRQIELLQTHAIRARQLLEAIQRMEQHTGPDPAYTDKIGWLKLQADPSIEIKALEIMKQQFKEQKK
jgi:hypothetical protein